MKTRILYDGDIEASWLGARTVAVIGYGAQGQAHALNLRDSGVNVTIGQRGGGRGWQDAIADGFRPVSIAQATAEADIVNLLLPDEVHGDVFHREIEPNLKTDAVVMACHGFSFHYNLVPARPGRQRVLVAPKGQGHMVRGEYVRGGGVPCLVAWDTGAPLWCQQLALAYAQAIGGSRAGVIETTIAAETETDLFGEQAVLCGGLTQLVVAGFETLVEAGYQPELAYFECLHELKIIVDLLHRVGLAGMRDVISTTAEYGDYTRGPVVIDAHVRDTMRSALEQIRSGEFAQEFLADCRNGSPKLLKFRAQAAKHPIEEVGQRLRALMPWLREA